MKNVGFHKIWIIIIALQSIVATLKEFVSPVLSLFVNGIFNISTFAAIIMIMQRVMFVVPMS